MWYTLEIAIHTDYFLTIARNRWVSYRWSALRIGVLKFILDLLCSLDSIEWFPSSLLFIYFIQVTNITFLIFEDNNIVISTFFNKRHIWLKLQISQIFVLRFKSIRLLLHIERSYTLVPFERPDQASLRNIKVLRLKFLVRVISNVIII